MNKYSPELKIKIAREYLDTHTTYVELAEKYNIANTSYVGLWVRQLKDNGEARIRSEKKTRYSKTFKKKVITYMYDNNISSLKTSLHFGIGHTTVTKWNKLYMEKGIKGLN